MSGKRVCVLLFSAVVLGVWVAAAAAESPLTRMFTLNRVEADPDKEYKLTEEHGPWMIMACSFSGDGAAEQARELVLELRSQYKLPAYVHQMQFDLGETYGRGVNRFGGPVRMQYRAGSDVQEIAVLVGNYRAVDDDDAQQTLRKLKYSVPECLAVEGGRTTHQSLAAL